jgi:haloacetate dehalogenase
VSYFTAVSGAGPPLLLLHGFPQTHHCWRAVTPVLSKTNTVVVCDLKGCGQSRADAGGPRGEGYSKREIAAELVEVMEQAGFERFGVAGHDRGARVAYRMALDHPDRVTRLAVLNVVPTVDQFDAMAEQVSLAYYPWYLLAQPAPLPERLLEASAAFYVRHTLDTWAAAPGVIEPERYVEAFTPKTIAAWCSEYRAAFHLDRELDAEDRAAGRRIECPVLVHWGAEEGGLADSGPLDVWRRWAGDVSGGPLRSGHFIPEEASEELTASLRAFFGP